MKIIKKIIKLGDSSGIILDKFIMESLDLKVGDLVDISDIIKVRRQKKNDGQI